MPAPGTLKKKITALKAWHVYRKVPAETRSINGLHAMLKAQGYAVSRKTLTAYAEEGRWDEKLATADERAAADPDIAQARAVAGDVIELASAGELNADLDTLLGACGAMAVGMAHTLMARISEVRDFDVSDVRTMSGAVVDVAKAMSEIQLARGGATNTPTGNATPSSPAGSAFMAFVQELSSRPSE